MRQIKPGKKYKHFKGDIYKVYAISEPIGFGEPYYHCKEVEHTETREDFGLVCYRNAEGFVYYHDKSVDTGTLVIYSKDNEKFWARPYNDFVSKVDKIKYPNATQEYRFEPYSE